MTPPSFFSKPYQSIYEYSLSWLFDVSEVSVVFVGSITKSSSVILGVMLLSLPITLAFRNFFRNFKIAIGQLVTLGRKSSRFDTLMFDIFYEYEQCFILDISISIFSTKQKDNTDDVNLHMYMDIKF